MRPSISISPRSSFAHKAQRSRGFTLLEIIVVTLVIGLTASMIGLSFNRDIDKVAYDEARRFGALLDQLREESIIGAETLGIEVNEADSSYQFLKSTDDSKWALLSSDDLFKRREFPEYLSIKLDIDVNIPGVKSVDPIIVADVMGEISPFTLSIIAEENIYQVSLDEGQNIKVSAVSKSGVK